MAGNTTSYLENKILDHIFNGITYTPPSTIYVGLVSDVATDSELETGDLTNEITGYEGGRKVITFNPAVQFEGEGLVENDIEINFNGMPKTNVAYAILCDAETSGNILYWLPADIIKTTSVDDIYRIRANDLKINLD